MRTIVAIRRILADAFGHFVADDGWAMASHVALSTLMALFPFLIFAASLAAFLGADAFADAAVHMIFDTWPEEIAAPLSREVLNVMTVQRGDTLTLGVVLALYFASNGVEALRTALNRAYRQRETRSILKLRLQSLFFVLVGGLTLVVASLLLVAAPVVMHLVAERFPGFRQYFAGLDGLRILTATVALCCGLISAHLWLPEGRRRLYDIMPGLIVTFLAWIAGSLAFASYLEYFSSYASTYAGLASIMVALIYLYMIAAIFSIGAELNAAIMRFHAKRVRVKSDVS